MENEIDLLKKELWKVYQVIKEINAVAELRELKDVEKDKLDFLIRQFRSIQKEIKEEENNE